MNSQCVKCTASVGFYKLGVYCDDYREIEVFNGATFEKY